MGMRIHTILKSPMTAKEFLQMGYFLDLRIKFKREHIEQLRTIAERATRSTTSISNSAGKNDARERAIASMVDQEQAIYADLAELAQIQMDIGAAIKAVSDPRLQLLLELRYLMYKTWEEIAEILCYDARHVYRLHAEALDMVIVPEKYKNAESA